MNVQVSAARSRLGRPAILGAFDGTASLLGVVVYLLVTHPALIFPAALSGAISSAVSMGGGEWLSDSDSGPAASAVMAAATFAGAVLPAIPFAVAGGPVICGCIGISVAAMRPRRMARALAETFGILAVILAVVLACGLLLPGGSG
jgi:hypothetical protein